MAKRRRLEVPSNTDLEKIEEGFARETLAGPFGAVPPIARVAAEAAAEHSPVDPQARAQAARDSADADRYRKALAEGLIVQTVLVNEIVVEELARDRMGEDAEAMDELKASIRQSGLRLPIELFSLPAERQEGGKRFGLISGWRRLTAMRSLLAETGRDEFATIKAIVRDPQSAGAAYLAMVEENEIRADLSHYERGRIAVMAAGQGAFASVEDAVNALFHAGSKAKRSKIRSFAELHEELGDLLSFPTHLSERQGLRLVAALRAGQGGALRAALATGNGVDPETEWALLEDVLKTADVGPARTGRPRKPAPRRERGDEIKLANGITICREVDGQGYAIRFKGKAVDAQMIDTVMLEIQRLLEPI